MNDEQFFTDLAATTDAMQGMGERAPSRLKSQIYSALVAEQAASGPLLPNPGKTGHGPTARKDIDFIF